jgi:multidrug resistance efflux pump
MLLALRRLLGLLVSLIALAGVVITGVLVTRRTNERPSTYDATIQAYVVNMAPEVSGRIVELNVLDNQQVKEGQVLFRIDPQPYQLSVDQARAAVRGLEAELSSSRARLRRRPPAPRRPRAGSTPPRLNSRSPRALWIACSLCSGAAS